MKTHSKWNAIVQDYIIKHSNQIQKTTRPIRDHFGIDYFTYHRIDHEGKYTVLVDRPNWAEHYVSEKIFLNDPYLRNFKVYQSGLCLVENHGSDEYKKTTIRAGKKILNVDLGVILIKKQQKYVEFFGFAGNKQTSLLEKLYLNDSHLLSSFATHFRKKLQPILTKMEEESISLLDLKGKDFLNSECISPFIAPDSRSAYLTDIGMELELEQTAKLSVRERQCLKLLVQDKSFKEIASDLQLSIRTVEFYFENIKNKLSCWSKQETLAIAKKLEALKLL